VQSSASFARCLLLHSLQLDSDVVLPEVWFPDKTLPVLMYQQDRLLLRDTGSWLE